MGPSEQTRPSAGPPGESSDAPTSAERGANDREALYRALIEASDPDALHDLIAARGPEILDLPFPYLVVAARNRLRDRRRRQAREIPMESVGPQTVSPARSPWDPLELAMARDALRRTLNALAAMDDRDVLVVWLAAQGLSDHEIASAWDSLGLMPRNPTLPAIRKRRERARTLLRRRAQVEV